MNKLEKLRMEKGLSQTDVAKKLQISKQRYSNYEKGRELDYDLLERLSDFYGVTSDYIIGIEDNRFNKTNKSAFNEKVKKLRIENGLTGAELAELIGVTKTAVSYWESGKSIANGDTIVKLASALNTTAEFLTGESEIQQSKEENKGIPFKSVKDQYSDDELLTILSDDSDGDMTIFEVKDNAMFPEFKVGDKLIAISEDIIENDKVYVVILNDKPILRKMTKKDNSIELLSINPDYSTIIVSNDDDFEMIGVVKGFLRKF